MKGSEGDSRLPILSFSIDPWAFEADSHGTALRALPIPWAPGHVLRRWLFGNCVPREAASHAPLEPELRFSGLRLWNSPLRIGQPADTRGPDRSARPAPFSPQKNKEGNIEGASFLGKKQQQQQRNIEQVRSCWEANHFCFHLLK